MTTRRTRYLAVLLLVGAVLLSGACAKTGGASVTLYVADSGRTIELKAGDALIVKLDGNPSTGFEWEVVALDEAVLAQEGEQRFEAEQAGLPGGGGTVTFNFAAKSKGQTELAMVYHQPWDKDASPSQIFTVTVVVDWVGNHRTA